jgi:hypothetical protein
MAFLDLAGRVTLLVALTLYGPAASGSAAAQSQTSSQQTSSQQAASESPSDPSRVKKALEQPSSGLLESAKKRTERLEDATFRVNVTEKALDIWDFWGEQPSPVPPYVRSWYFSNWHEEYLRMVTPEYARRAALYPAGMLSIPVVPTLVNAVKSALRVRAERRAKEEVEDALEQFFEEHPEARRAAPAAPPTEPGRM